MCSFEAQASGISIAMACGISRPARYKSSSTLSKLAESEPSGVTIGNSFLISSPNSGDSRIDCRAYIQFTLPLSVLISPLWAM